MTYHDVLYSEHNSSSFGHLDRIEQDVKNQSRALADAISAGAGPVVSLPESIRILESKGRGGDVNKLIDVTKVLASDVDKFTSDAKELDSELDHLIRTRPRNKSDCSRHYNKFMTLGQRYIELNGRVLNTVLKSVDIYADIVGHQESSRG